MPHGAVPFPFGSCRICGDSATGAHYGVATCEGCKGFFKRSLLKAEKYKCFFGGQCMLSPKSRNRCKYCRFQRCLQVGMSVSAVKMGRIPKVEKEKALCIERQKQSTGSPQDESTSAASTALDDNPTASFLPPPLDDNTANHPHGFTSHSSLLPSLRDERGKDTNLNPQSSFMHPLLDETNTNYFRRRLEKTTDDDYGGSIMTMPSEILQRKVEMCESNNRNYGRGNPTIESRSSMHHVNLEDQSIEEEDMEHQDVEHHQSTDQLGLEKPGIDHHAMKQQPTQHQSMGHQGLGQRGIEHQHIEHQHMKQQTLGQQSMEQCMDIESMDHKLLHHNDYTSCVSQDNIGSFPDRSTVYSRCNTSNDQRHIYISPTSKTTSQVSKGDLSVKPLVISPSVNISKVASHMGRPVPLHMTRTTTVPSTGSAVYVSPLPVTSTSFVSSDEYRFPRSNNKPPWAATTTTTTTAASIWAQTTCTSTSTFSPTTTAAGIFGRPFGRPPQSTVTRAIVQPFQSTIDSSTKAKETGSQAYFPRRDSSSPSVKEKPYSHGVIQQLMSQVLATKHGEDLWQCLLHDFLDTASPEEKEQLKNALAGRAATEIHNLMLSRHNDQTPPTALTAEQAETEIHNLILSRRNQNDQTPPKVPLAGRAATEIHNLMLSRHNTSGQDLTPPTVPVAVKAAIGMHKVMLSQRNTHHQACTPTVPMHITQEGSGMAMSRMGGGINMPPGIDDIDVQGETRDITMSGGRGSLNLPQRRGGITRPQGRSGISIPQERGGITMPQVVGDRVMSRVDGTIQHPSYMTHKLDPSAGIPVDVQMSNVECNDPTRSLVFPREELYSTHNTHFRHHEPKRGYGNQIDVGGVMHDRQRRHGSPIQTQHDLTDEAFHMENAVYVAPHQSQHMTSYTHTHVVTTAGVSPGISAGVKSDMGDMHLPRHLQMSGYSSPLYSDGTSTNPESLFVTRNPGIIHRSHSDSMDSTQTGMHMAHSKTCPPTVTEILQEFDCYLSEDESRNRKKHALKCNPLSDSSPPLLSKEYVDEPFSQSNNTESEVVDDKGIPDCDARQILDDDSKTMDAKDTMDECGQSLGLDVKHTVAVLEKLKDHYLEHVRERLQMMYDEIEGRRPVHKLNKINQASKKQVEFVWDQLFKSIPLISEMILGLCSGMPGFDQLEDDDKQKLMSAAFFDIWMVVNAKMFHREESYLRLPCGSHYSRWWMNHFLPEHLIQQMFFIAESLNEFDLNEVHLTALSAIRLTKPDLPELNNPGSVKLVHNHYLDTFAHILHQSHPVSHNRMIAKIFDILGQLGPLSEEQGKVIGTFRVDQPPDGCLQYCEMEGEEDENDGTKDEMTT